MIHSKTELDVHLEEKLHPHKLDDVDDGFDILKYWKSNALKFPILPMIARDILTIPASSGASKSAFSTKGYVLNKFCNSLLPSTVEALVVLKIGLEVPQRRLSLKKNLIVHF